ncbi:phage baseplate assembly protein V [Erwinia tracheiphila]|uniref:Phage baseplate assembly protein V n=1 Tax=Erwinia tracheiphila TaxID=65700 RepID=A0A345CWU3_9GAMM|nr:phage baseplate assembly protein V [Erwinia tracheiphila]AXF77910.1 phage baseplate assembly protein V [Erwinia tracheiphila]UIA83382.1 phage baseplate assembly protein V [Erwinia tracheiphila]UIA91962.1 phage baseplate assembly protein V [Erwinia tracheiphila]
MAISVSERAGGEQELLDTLHHALSSQLRVAMPGIIQSFDAETVTCTVQPAIKGVISDQNGSTQSVALPLLVDVPVVFPRGGGVTLTFPVATGDECLVVFADRCIDFWWQNGGVQESVDPRQHDLSDAFALPGPQSQKQKIGAISSSGAQLRSDDGLAYVEVAAGHDITVKTPGKLSASAEGGAEITAPEIVLNGNVTINGNLSQGMGSSGGSANINGPVTVKSDVTAAGISLSSHVHSGVQSGSSNTGKPQ